MPRPSPSDVLPAPPVLFLSFTKISPGPLASLVWFSILNIGAVEVADSKPTIADLNVVTLKRLPSPNSNTVPTPRLLLALSTFAKEPP